MFYIWLMIVVLLTIVEVITINLTTIWFVISGIITIVVSFFTDNFTIQFGVFSIVGILLLLTTRKTLEKRLIQNREKTNLDRVIGMIGIVTEAIDKNHPGEVKVDGKRWTAISNQKIEENATVKILEIDGVKLKVKKEDN